MSGIQSVSVSASQSYASVAAQAQQSLQPFSNLNLTEAQRTQLRSIFSAAKQDGTSPADVQKEVSSILTPAQQQALSADLKAGGNFGEHHQHEHSHDSESTTLTSAALAPSSSTTASGSSSTATRSDEISNVQNQAAAAQSALSAASGASAQTAATPAISPAATVLAAITNIQNQAAAAQSTLLETLQQQVLATNGDTTVG